MGSGDVTLEQEVVIRRDPRPCEKGEFGDTHTG